MKGLILAAGLGTRLRPITNTIPKCLVPINGKPLLAYHLEALGKAGVKEVLINTHYLSEQVETFLEKWRKKNKGLHVQTVFEKELLGSAGTLRSNMDFFIGESDFYVIYGDNFTNIKYKNLLNAHRKNKGLVTIAVYYESEPWGKGVVEYDALSKRVIKFIEKPKIGTKVTGFINGGIYLLSSSIFQVLQGLENVPLDFGFHVFPKLLENEVGVYAYETDEIILDVGSHESYAKAHLIAKKIF